MIEIVWDFCNLSGFMKEMLLSLELLVLMKVYGPDFHGF